MRRFTVFKTIPYLIALLSLTGCGTDSTAEPGCDDDIIDITIPSRSDNGTKLASGTSFRAIVFGNADGAYYDSGTYFIKTDGDNNLTPAEITYDSNNNIITGTTECREKALHKYLTKVKIYLVSPACNINTNNGCLLVNPEVPLYVSNQHYYAALMDYAPLDFSGDILKNRRSRLIVNFFQLSEFSTETGATIKDVELHNAGTFNEVLYHLPTNRVVTDDSHRIRTITLIDPETAKEITFEGKNFKLMKTTGNMHVVSATYSPHTLTSSLSSDYIYLNFSVYQNGVELPQSLLLTDNLFETLEPGLEYSYRVLLSSEIIQLTLVISPWNVIDGISTEINSGLAGEYNLGTWNINGWGQGTPGDSGNTSISNKY
ncbi:MAG: hypothetical protein NC221_08055 [Duncaniella sp.]|nr:hypothetical protein [Muribaculum sp.]MCM1256058.1 hypothetical protein [Duncaniella sp.]